MTNQSETPLQLLAAINAKLVEMQARIGQLQLRLAQADADRCEAERIDREEFGVRYSLDD